MEYPGTPYVLRLQEAVEFLKTLGRPAEAALILGTGLGDFADSLEDPLSISYAEIPNFKASAVLGHAGRAVFGRAEGKNIVALQGRIHCYEGHTAAEVAFAARALALFGIRRFLITNAAGGLNREFEAGDLMLIENHITLFVEDPSRGIYHPQLGEQFYPQTDPYNLKRAAQLRETAGAQGVSLKGGVYCYLPGPRYESRADIEAVRRLGADAVGMSTVPEVLALANMGVSDIIGISLVTNLAAGIADKDPSHEEVLAAGEAAKPKFEKVVRMMLEDM